MAKVELETIRQAAAGRWPSILQSVAGIAPEHLDPSKEHPCPKCGGTTRFRLVDEAAGAVRCSHCFSKNCGDGFAAVQWMAGSTFPAAVDRVAEYLGLTTKREADPSKDLTFEDWTPAFAKLFCQAKPGLTEEGLILSGARMARYQKRFTVIAWPIIGADLDCTKAVGWVVANYNGAPLPKFNREGVQIGQSKYKITRGSTKPGFIGRYGIERLKPGIPELVWKVEGMSDLIALQGLIPAELRDRHLVVTNKSGSKEQPRWQGAALAPYNCNVLHDADEPGQSGAKLWATEIASQSPAGVAVKNVELPFDVAEHHGKDLRDWINEGGTYAQLLTLADQSLALSVARTEDGEIDYSQIQYPVQELILKKLQLEVLYEDETGAVRVFSTLPQNRKSSMIRDVSRLKKETLIQVCGAPAKVHISKEPDGETTWSLDDVREAIALAASSRRGRGDERGIGVWQGLDVHGNETSTVVLVGAADGARWNGDKILRKIPTPRADGLVLDFGSSHAEWYDFDTLSRHLAASADVEWRSRVVEEAISLFGRWRWRHQEIDPTLMTGLILATWVQTIFDWRPLVAISGESNSGKSMLFGALGGTPSQRGIFGSLAFKQAKSTAAGIMQGLGNTARVALCDEFEASRERTKVLEAFRQSTRGESTAKGTSHHKGVEFALRHICWVAAIETGLDRQPDNNRFVQFELLKAEEGQHGKLRTPSGRELTELGQKLLAIAVRSAIAAKKLAVTLKDTQVEGVDPRTVESYSVPAAMLAEAAGESEEWARSMLVKLTGNVDKADQGRIDHEQLLTDIMAASVNLGGRGVLTVGQILESTSYRADHATRLEAAGICLYDTGQQGRLAEYGLFVVPRVVQQQLLRGGSWDGQKIDQILLRLHGATRHRVRIGGLPQRGIVIPPSVLQPDFLKLVEGASGF